MLQKFPTGADLQRWATSSSWPLFVTGDYTSLASNPSPKLNKLASIYNMPGLGGAIVRQNIAAIAQVSSTRFSPSDNSLDIAARLFIGKYGHTCTLYMMMTYFANYTFDYKRTVGTFDLGDLLSGYRKFEDKWNIAVGKITDSKSLQGSSSKLSGTRALKNYILQAIREHGEEEYIREGTRPYNANSDNAEERKRPEFGGLIRMGFVTPEKVREIAYGIDASSADDAEAF